MTLILNICFLLKGVLPFEMSPKAPARHHNTSTKARRDRITGKVVSNTPRKGVCASEIKAKADRPIKAMQLTHERTKATLNKTESAFDTFCT